MPGRERVRPPKRRTHQPLSDDMHQDRFVVPGENRRKRQQAKQQRDEAEQQDGLIDNEIEAGLMPHKMAKRILLQSRQRREGDRQQQQQRGGNNDDEEDPLDEDAAMNDDDDDGAYDDDDDDYNNNIDDDDDDEDDEDDNAMVDLEYDDNESMAESEMVEFPDLAAQYELDDEEARLLGKFQPQAPTQSRNLADIILEKIREKEAGAAAAAASHQHQCTASEMGDGSVANGGVGGPHIDNRVRRVYVAIGRVLRGYTAGKIPKAFKILPRVQNWEQLILLTKPEEWSPHATYAAVRIFAAALNERMAQRFYSTILLPIVHNHIMHSRHLHPALYMALRKALFKPIAFYKGFLLPLCAAGECSLREALIVGSVLQKMHLQPIPTAVVIVKICEMGFSSPNVLFLRVLIDKKISLPFQAIDALVAYFHRFAKAHGRDQNLPVLWHQALLSFCQRYKGEFKPEQIALLHEVCNKHFHQLITPETRRELAAAVGAKSSMH